MNSKISIDCQLSCLSLPHFAPETEDSFVNLGARDGLADDPLQFLLREPRHVEFALAVEMDPERRALERDWELFDVENPWKTMENP